MYDYNHVMQGLEKFINMEMLAKVPGWKKWVVGTGMELAIMNTKQIMEELEHNDFVKMLGVFDDNHHVDVEKLYTALKNQVKDGDKAEIELPLVGKFTLDRTDIDKLYTYIIE